MHFACLKEELMAIEITAPMVGKIVKVLVEDGQSVSEDDPVIMLEAMKVEMPVVAPEDGTVSAISVKEGDTVEAGTVLVELEEA
jgi:biotin carboxyl carrier protein